MLMPPDAQDHLSHYLYLPYLTTLYGYDALPNRWLRVVDDGSGNFERILSSGGTVNYIIETVEVSTFMNYITYGFTPYLEVAFCNLESGIDLSRYRYELVNLSSVRNYESRCSKLMEIAKKKHNSILTKSSPVSKELMVELYCTLYLWEQLMNTGNLKAYNCLDMLEKQPPQSISLSWANDKLNELKARTYHDNYKEMKFKTDSANRAAMLSSFGCRI